MCLSFRLTNFIQPRIFLLAFYSGWAQCSGTSIPRQAQRRSLSPPRWMLPSERGWSCASASPAPTEELLPIPSPVPAPGLWEAGPAPATVLLFLKGTSSGLAGTSQPSVKAFGCCDLVVVQRVISSTHLRNAGGRSQSPELQRLRVFLQLVGSPVGCSASLRPHSSALSAPALGLAMPSSSSDRFDCMMRIWFN